jgi:hypothetical protein
LAGGKEIQRSSGEPYAEKHRIMGFLAKSVNQILV